MGSGKSFGKRVIEIFLCFSAEGHAGQAFRPEGWATIRIFFPLKLALMALLTGNAIEERLLSVVAPEGLLLQIPPACLIDMQGEPLEYEEGVSLTVRFPVLPRYANPLGHMQGGYIVAALDNTVGPFSYLIAPPSVTSSLNTQYLRPVTSETRFITCIARLTERTRGTLYLAGEARNPEGKVVAMCQAVCQILPTKS